MAERPVRSPELAAEICNRMRAGKSLRQVCRDDDMPSRTFVLDWLNDDTAFASQYARAREALVEHWADEIIAISDDAADDYAERERENGEKYEAFSPDHVNRARLRIDSRKWLMSKLAPRKYGDKLELGGNVTLKHEDALAQVAAVLAAHDA